MVTLKIAGLVVAALMGFGFTPVYMDYTALGRRLRLTWAEMRANASYPVGFVLMCITAIPLGMLIAALLQGKSAGAIVLGFVLTFVVFAVIGIMFSPGPKNLDLPKPESYLAHFAEEAEA